MSLIWILSSPATGENIINNFRKIYRYGFWGVQYLSDGEMLARKLDLLVETGEMVIIIMITVCLREYWVLFGFELFSTFLLFKISGILGFKWGLSSCHKKFSHKKFNVGTKESLANHLNFVLALTVLCRTVLYCLTWTNTGGKQLCWEKIEKCW